MSKLPATWRALQTAERGRRRKFLATSVSGNVPPVDSAKAAGLRYVNDARMPGIRRIGRGKRFRYVDPAGITIADAAVQQRIRSLVIPPAWTDVWICPDARGHVQATGRDARGRKQYRYHPRWRDVRDEVKYGRLLSFAQALPRIRMRVEEDVRRGGLPREKVLATVVQLLEKTLIRVGNEEYARHNGSIGLTTMRDRHAKVQGQSVRFEFRGKSGISHAIDLRDARLTRIVKACRELPGYELFQYLDADGRRQVIDSADVNAYVRELSGQDFTAKDFRTWAGTVLAAKALAEIEAFTSAADAKRKVARAIDTVAKRLGNTKTVCRKCYIHPIVIDAYLDGATIATARTRPARPAASALTDEEAAVVRLVEQRLRKSA